MNKSKFEPGNVIMFWYKGDKHMCVIWSVVPIMRRGEIVDYSYTVCPENTTIEVLESRLWNENNFSEVMDQLSRL